MYVYGKNVAIEVLNNKKNINKAYIQNSFCDKDILNLLKVQKIKTTVLSKFELDKKVKGLHQGIVLDVDDYKYYNLEDIIKENGFIVMLDHIEDPHNFGAIIRTCEAAGVDAIIIPNDRSVSVNATVIKTSVGTTEKMKIVRVVNLNNAINYLKKNGYWIIGTDCVGENYTDIDYNGKVCIICGNEGAGMAKLVSSNCDFIAKIPMNGTVNSLNASVATAIVVFEAVKKRKA